MEEGLLPHSRAIFEENEVEEERRLCYVGITRAKEKLYFSYARSRFTYGYSSNSLPSRFLAEIKQNLLTTNRSFDQGQTNNYHSFYGNKKKTQSAPANDKKIRLVIDEDSLDALLNDELDIREFLRK